METINHTLGESDFRKATGWEGNLSLFFSDSYKEYVTYRHHNQKKFSIVYSEEYAIPVLIRQYWIFVYAEFLSSPIAPLLRKCTTSKIILSSTEGIYVT